jgi:hypothetical protein
MGTNYVDNLSEELKKGLLSERASGIDNGSSVIPDGTRPLMRSTSAADS